MIELSADGFGWLVTLAIAVVFGVGVGALAWWMRK
jgi:hypothetical protein